MSNAMNPYQPPVVTDEPVVDARSADGAAAVGRQLFGKAGPWLRFLGVVNYIWCGITAVTGVVFLVTSFTGTKLFGNSAGSALAGPAIGLLYLAIAVVLFFPSRYVFAMGSNAKRYMQDGEAITLEGVAANLKKTAKFYGVVAIVSLATVPALSIIGIIGGIAGHSAG